MSVHLELIQTPFHSTFEKFAESIVTNCLICSPYITSGPIYMLVKKFAQRKRQNDIQIDILTDISYRTLIQGGTETSALLYLCKHHPNTRITYLPKIHAKVYIANRAKAIVASANFTQGGSQTNLEYGVGINDSSIVQKIQNDIEGYRELGADVTQNELQTIHEQVEFIKPMIEKEQRNIAKTIRKYSVELPSAEHQRKIENGLIKTRVKNDNVNAIFSKTLLYLLSKGPAKTKDLNIRVSNIHPDLCDDSMERIIDGVSYGKKWKHQVRNAQLHLKRNGKIFREKNLELWHMTKT